MIAKVTSVNGKSGNRLEIALGMHLHRELTKDPHIELNSIRETIAVFLLDNKKKFKGCKVEKIRVMHEIRDGTDLIHVQRTSDCNCYGFYQIIEITFYDESDLFPI